ncbi:MAG: hypothetical protein D6689_05605 [Deltaproteobacteria bacterium]|nr:MAG: hypothetical protein D6689_05605 [Deltaproteobacteria bacterium]
MVKLACSTVFALVLAAACGGGDDDDDATVDAAPAPDADVRGTVSFAWSLSDGSGPITCDDVGADAVSISLLPVGVQGGTSDVSGCPNGASSGTFQSRGVPPRDYDVEITISAAQGDLIDEPIRFKGVTVAPAQDTALGDVEFVVDPVGNLTFSLRALEPGGNCAPVDDDGAAITKFELELSQGGTCVPVDFAIHDPTGVLEATYATTCAGEQHDACIPEDRELRVADIGSGPTRLSVVGYRDGDLPCYVTTADIDVPGNDLTAAVGAISIPLDMSNDACAPPMP